MDNQEALQVLQTKYHINGPIKQVCKELGAREVAVEALKKQIPMEITDVHVDEYYCPACGSENNCDQGIVGDKFCPECGQAIYQQN